MKTIIKITTLLVLATMAFHGKAQTVTSCSAGSNVTIWGVNSFSLTNPTYSLEPGGITSPFDTFVVTPISNTSYTIYVTGTSTSGSIQTTSNVVDVNVSPVNVNVVKTCSTVNVVLTGVSNYTSGALNYFWSSNTFTSSAQSITVTPPSTLITLQVTDPATGCSATQTTNVLLNPSIPTASANPLTQSVSCGSGVVATVTGTAINPTLNVTHSWFSPNSPVPFTSSGQFSVFNPVVGTTTYVVTDNLNGCSSNPILINVTSSSGFPTFNVVSAGNFTLGCSTRSITDITIINPNTTLPPGGAVSFTILPPSFTGSTYTYNTVLTQTFNVPGNYTVIVIDNGNQCETRVTIPLIQNLTPPNILASTLTRTLTCYTPSVTLEGSSTTNPVYYNWSFMNGSNPNNIPNPIITVTNNPSQTALTQSIINTYTLTVTDANNLCISNTVVTMMQNVRPPIPVINGTGTFQCLITMFTLANGSSCDPAPGFYSPLGTQATLWQGPSPQTNSTNVAFYEAYTPGTYSMTVMDLNNGCVSMATVNMGSSPRAAFSHTITGGLAVFSNESTYTTTNTTYLWDFGDGYTSFMQNPTHTYINGGAHLVKLRLTDPMTWCADSVIQSVNVSGVPCSANSNFSMVPTSTAQVWNVVPSYPWNIAAASWSWGDGSFSNTLYTSHQYSAAGMYNICLTVTVSCAATSSTCASYSVYKVSQEAMIIAVNVVAPELISGIVSLASNEQLSWDILPNPNSGEFSLNLSKTLSEPARVFINDLTGRVLHEQFIEPDLTSTSINTGKLPSGLYLVTIESNGLRTTKRMIVNR
jgi:PKD repeat protein